MTGYIYCYTNKINGKKYIGQTTKTLEIRAGKNGIGYDRRHKFGKAIEKYGWDNFSVEIIEDIELEDSIELHSKLNNLEKYYINFFDTYRNGYNSDLGGNSHEISIETRIKISETLKSKKQGRIIHKDTLKKQSESLKGRIVTPEMIKKQKETKAKQQGHWYNNGIKNLYLIITDEIPDGFVRGRLISEEQKQANRVRTIGRKATAEERQKMSASHIKRFENGDKPWNYSKSNYKINSKGKRKRMESLNEIKYLYEFCYKLQQTNSRNEKLLLLSAYKDDEVVKKFLQYTFNPFITFGIKSAKISADLPSKAQTYNNCSKSLFEILEYLRTHNTGRGDDVFKAKMFVNMYAEYKDFLISIITKNLNLGIDVKSINKIIPNLIPQFSVMLANKYFDMKPNFLEGKEFAITTKIDGMRCIMLKENGNVTFWSRQGQPIEGLVDLEEEAKKYIPDTVCLDGELIADVNSPDTYKDTMKRARTKDVEKHGLKMMVFDYMTVDEFKNQCANNVYHKRRDLLDSVFDGTWFIHDFKYFEKLPILYQGRDTSKIIELLEEQTAQGQEGVMINVCDAYYDFKRTNNLLKVKKMQTLDLEVVGFEEGANSNQGTLGALLVRYKDGNIVKVGSGFEKELRDEIWNNQKDWLGKIVEVQYFEETENADGNKSLRFPVYKDYRTDKLEADY